MRRDAACCVPVVAAPRGETVRHVRSAVRGTIAVVLALILAGVSMVGCDDPPSEDSLSNGALTEIYVAVLTHAQQHSSFNPDPSTVFVKPLSDGQVVPLDAQVGIVEALREQFDVVFVDADDEAFGKDDSIREGGAFVAVGPVVRRQASATVMFQEIFPNKPSRSWTMSFRERDDVWTASGVEAE